MSMSIQSIEVYFDGDCPLCSKEIAWLKRRDAHGGIHEINIAARDFASPEGYTQDQLMARIHARLPSGQMIEGVEVFRHLYAIVGLGAWVPASRLPGIRHVLDASYRIFARFRVPLGRRCTAATCRIKPTPKSVQTS